MINAVINDRIISEKEKKLLEEGSKQIFPLSYSDVEAHLKDHRNAKERLEYLKSIWIKSDFKIASEKLKKYL